MSFEERRSAASTSLRALSHPLRLRLIELLQHSGPLTATEAAGHLGTTPSNCSFHLRLLARHGYVTEAEPRRGRQRPWRLVDADLHVEVDELGDEGRDAVRMFVAAAAEQYRRRAFEWLARRDRYGAAWRDAAGESHLIVNMTAAELSAVREAVEALLQPHLARASDPAPPGTEPIAVLFSTLPIVGPQPDTSETEHQ